MSDDTKPPERLYQRKPGEVYAEIVVRLPFPDDDGDAPSLYECRYAVLPIIPERSNHKKSKSYAIYDRLLSRVVDGMYFVLQDAMEVAASLSHDAQLPEDTPGRTPEWEPPSGRGLGLLYPDWPAKKS